jgi:hypothetical protein
VVGVAVVAWALLEQDQVVLVEPVVVVREERGQPYQAQPLDQMVLTVLAVEVVAQVVQQEYIKHLVAATAALA